MGQSAGQRAASLRNLAKARKATKGHAMTATATAQAAAPHRSSIKAVNAVHAAASPVAHRKKRLRRITLHL